jgi:small subunit ribosomal protein S20
MANIRSAEKRMRQSEKRRIRNAAARGTVRTAIKTARTALGGTSVPEAREALTNTIRVLDKAVTKGIVHRNAAARRKSRLTRQLNALAASSRPAAAR